MNESKISSVVPRGHTKPQKKRPKSSVATITITDRIEAVMIARYATLVMMSMSGSKLKKIFWNVAGAL